MHWIADPPESPDLHVRVRHGRALHAARADFEGNRGHVRLRDKDQGIAPGQFAVFYQGEVCLGGATIEA